MTPSEERVAKVLQKHFGLFRSRAQLNTAAREVIEALREPKMQRVGAALVVDDVTTRSTPITSSDFEGIKLSELKVGE